MLGRIIKESANDEISSWFAIPHPRPTWSQLHLAQVQLPFLLNRQDFGAKYIVYHLKVEASAWSGSLAASSLFSSSLLSSPASGEAAVATDGGDHHLFYDDYCDYHHDLIIIIIIIITKGGGNVGPVQWGMLRAMEIF